jgi:hypothetical protein
MDDTLEHSGTDNLPDEIERGEADLPPFCEDGCGQRVTPGLVFGKPRRYIRGHGPQAKGQNRPKTAALPPGQSPSLDELKAVSDGKGKPEGDRAPGKPKGRGKGRARPKTNADVPPFRAGPIAAGMNKLYARTGKIVQVLDPEVGGAIISVTRKESADDVTVGEAWEELAKTNPRIRAFLLKMIQGGTWGQLIMAHAPIFLAVIMKDGIRKHIPFMKLIEAMLSDDEATGEASPISTAMGGMTEADVAQAMQFAQGLMGQMGIDLARGMSNGQRETVPGDVVASYPEGARPEGEAA